MKLRNPLPADYIRTLRVLLLLGTVIVGPFTLILIAGASTQAVAENSRTASSQRIATSRGSQRGLGKTGLLVTKRQPNELEIERLKQKTGVAEEQKCPNVRIGAHGTGLRSPTISEWTEISSKLLLVENVALAGSPPATVDHSKDPWFPPIGNQDGEGSCVAWAVGYYVKTFQEAREHGWNVSSATWEGGYHGYPSVSYQDRIFSPDFIYHLINSGQDQGSSYFDAINLVCAIGAATWGRMPYTPSEYTSWPSEDAWHEASLYRGNSSGYEAMILSTDSDITNLKNWIALGNLAIVSVDANQYSKLTSDDVWTLDNYVTPSENHANTIVGYDDSFAYTEEGMPRNGAFKIANSWGVGGWEKAVDGFYWISYEAMKQRVGFCMFYEDKVGYQPEILASFRIEHPKRAECDITIGVGDEASPIQTKHFNGYIDGGDLPFPLGNIVIDITEFKNQLQTLWDEQFFLRVYDGGSSTNGTITDFSTNYLHSQDVPVSTVNHNAVYVKLLFSPTSVVRVIPQSLLLPDGQVTGQKLTVAVVVEDVSSLFSFDLGFSWDQNYLQYENHTVTVPFQDYVDPIAPSPYGGTMNQGSAISLNEINQTAGSLKITCESGESAEEFTGNGTMFVITLGIKHQLNSTVQVPLIVTSSILCDEYGLSLLHRVKEGSVIIPPFLDTTPPTVLIISPQPRSYDTDTVPLTFLVSEPCPWIGYSLDDTANVTIATNATINVLKEGSHGVVVYATDTSGNTGESEIMSFSISIDHFSIEVLSPENSTYPHNSVELELATSRQASWIAYSLDGGLNVTISQNCTLHDLADEHHNIVFYATDTAGNTASSDNTRFTVDTRPPNLTDMSQYPGIREIEPEIGVSVSVTATDAVSGVRRVTLNYTAGNGKWATINMTPLQDNVWRASIPAFGSSARVEYLIVAEDNVGNRITSAHTIYEYPNQTAGFPMATIIGIILMLLASGVVLVLLTLSRYNEASV